FWGCGPPVVFNVRNRLLGLLFLRTEVQKRIVQTSAPTLQQALPSSVQRFRSQQVGRLRHCQES
ncbi:hypothetical protein BgiBS90_019604, partial [Biomphalaria glabrata]